MYLKELLKMLPAYEAVGEGWENTVVTGLCSDHRLVKKGDLFLCQKGEGFDSHLVALEAVKKGAVALVCAREVKVSVPQIIVKNTRRSAALIGCAFYGEPSKKMRIVGITGTNGKTTTAYMLASILRRAGKEVGLIGTLGIYYANKRIAPELTTPDPIDLQETLADMAALGVEIVVMEVSAHALYYDKDAGINYDACIFTNLSRDHLDFFKDMDVYAAAKKGLFLAERCRLAVLNADDPFGLQIGEERTGETLFYGLDTPAHSFAVTLEEGIYGSELMLNLSDRLARVRLQLTGRHNIYNALAAATAALTLGVSPEKIAEGLSLLTCVKGRLEPVCEYKGGKVFVDFAHTPDGLKNSLTSLKRFCRGRLLCVFGCGGNRDGGKRPEMGRVAAGLADFSILTSDNPRYEDPMDIISAIERGYRPVSARYVIVPERSQAIAYALELLKEGDILLVAGKGGEEYQEIMGIKYYSNDNALIKEKIKERGGCA